MASSNPTTTRRTRSVSAAEAAAASTAAAVVNAAIDDVRPEDSVSQVGRRSAVSTSFPQLLVVLKLLRRERKYRLVRCSKSNDNR